MNKLKIFLTALLLLQIGYWLILLVEYHNKFDNSNNSYVFHRNFDKIRSLVQESRAYKQNLYVTNDKFELRYRKESNLAELSHFKEMLIGLQNDTGKDIYSFETYVDSSLVCTIATNTIFHPLELEYDLEVFVFVSKPPIRPNYGLLQVDGLYYLYKADKCSFTKLLIYSSCIPNLFFVSFIYRWFY